MKINLKKKIFYTLERIKVMMRNRKFGIYHNFCDIPSDVFLPRSTRFPHHALGIVIGHGIKIGENVTMGNFVTLGDGGGNHPGVPTIQDNVHIHPYCCVLGKITIGRNTDIGAYSLVLDDIPPNSIAYGIPAKVIRKKE
ncbi:MAG: hypothetical protein NTV74_06835 [Euryarchaeota archaeon]|nr:hypothetical protein [Euryarchaeota archaeon]